MESKDPPDVKVRLAGLSIGVEVPGDTVAVRPTLPAKPLRLATMTKEVSDEPAGIVREEGLVETLKSTAWTVIVAERDRRDRESLVPVTVTV